MKLEASFESVERFETVIQKVGYKQDHLVKLLKYARLLQQETEKAVSADLNAIEFVKAKLERNAKVLLRVQELVQNQIYYIGIHQESN